MVSKQHCPHTGVINYFTEADPFLSVGSIIKAGSSTGYHWRYYNAAKTIAGIARDMSTAERRLKTYIRKSSTEE